MGHGQGEDRVHGPGDDEAVCGDKGLEPCLIRLSLVSSNKQCCQEDDSPGDDEAVCGDKALERERVGGGSGYAGSRLYIPGPKLTSVVTTKEAASFRNAVGATIAHGRQSPNGEALPAA